MCKVQKITYSCTHTHTIQLSKCRGTKIFQADPESETFAACLGKPRLYWNKPNPCGECQKQSIQDSLDAQLEALHARITDWRDPERVAAEAANVTRCDQLQKEFPPAQFKKDFRPEAGRRTAELTHSHSLLRFEVMPEDVVVDWQDEWKAKPDWSTPAFGDVGDGIETEEWQPDTSRKVKLSVDADDGWLVVGTAAAESTTLPVFTKTKDVETPEDTFTTKTAHQVCNEYHAPQDSAHTTTVEDDKSTVPEPLAKPRVIPPHERHHNKTSTAVRYKMALSLSTTSAGNLRNERLKGVACQYLVTVSP